MLGVILTGRSGRFEVPHENIKGLTLAPAAPSDEAVDHSAMMQAERSAERARGRRRRRAG